VRPLAAVIRLAARFGLARLPLGPRAERYAARYLRRKGYRIVARNRTHRHGEIDLIAIDRTFLVFVEVRARASEDFMTPEQSIRPAKRRTVATTVRRLVRKHKAAGLTPRIDVIAIIWPAGAKRPGEVRHHQGAIPVALW
jgi:putative endonuclease